MSGKKYKARAIVLKKTRMGEKDLVVTMLDESGALLKGVAKGARKPGGSLAARMELFSTVDLLCAEGKSLDVICEAKLVTAGSVLEFGLEQAACASPIAELASFLAQEGLPQPRFFDMTRSAIEHIRKADTLQAAVLCAAGLWKLMAQGGFRPRFQTCAICGKELSGQGDEEQPRFSFVDGGAVCKTCLAGPDFVRVEKNLLGWCAFFIASPFDEICSAAIDAQTAFASIQLSRQWIRFHLNRNLRSLDFMLSSGVF